MKEGGPGGIDMNKLEKDLLKGVEEINAKNAKKGTEGLSLEQLLEKAAEEAADYRMKDAEVRELRPEDQEEFRQRNIQIYRRLFEGIIGRAREFFRSYEERGSRMRGWSDERATNLKAKGRDPKIIDELSTGSKNTIDDMVVGSKKVIEDLLLGEMTGSGVSEELAMAFVDQIIAEEGKIVRFPGKK